MAAQSAGTVSGVCECVLHTCTRMLDSEIATAGLGRGGSYRQLRRRTGSLSAVSNYVRLSHAGPLSNVPRCSHANTHTHKTNTQHSLMIESCDCRLPATLAPLRGPPQHKSMSITSPEHIRHLPFLLIISTVHRRIRISQPASQATKTGNKMNSVSAFKCARANEMADVVWNGMHVIHQLTLSLNSHTHTHTLGGL